jgi:hypothetical protein
MEKEKFKENYLSWFPNAKNEDIEKHYNDFENNNKQLFN